MCFCFFLNWAVCVGNSLICLFLAVMVGEGALPHSPQSAFRAGSAPQSTPKQTFRFCTWRCCSVNYDSPATGGGTSRACCKLVKIVMSLLSSPSLLNVDICFKTLIKNVLCTLAPNWTCTCVFACDFIMLKGCSIWIKHDDGFPFRMPC